MGCVLTQCALGASDNSGAEARQAQIFTVQHRKLENAEEPEKVLWLSDSWDGVEPVNMMTDDELCKLILREKPQLKYWFLDNSELMKRLLAPRYGPPRAFDKCKF